jgi:hypothetical protein
MKVSKLCSEQELLISGFTDLGVTFLAITGE